MRIYIQLRGENISFVMSVCPSVRPNGTDGLTMEEFFLLEFELVFSQTNVDRMKVYLKSYTHKHIVFPREAEETAFIKERCDLRLKNYLSIKHRALLLKSGTYPARLFITVAVLAITATPTDEGTAKK
jgi:hypothetical protein